MKKRLLYISNLFPRKWNMNRGIFNFQQIAELSRSYTIEALVPIAWTNFPIKTFKLKDLDAIELNSVKISYLVFFFIPRITVFFNGISMFFSILLSQYLKIKRFKPDAIYSSWAYPDGFASILLGSVFKIPVAIGVMGSDINDFTNNRLIKNQITWALSKSAAIISVSQDLKNKMIQLGVNESKIHVVYRGVNNQLFKFQNKLDSRKQLDLPSNKYTLLFIGNLIETKGCMDLFYATKECVNLGLDIQLIFMGSGHCTKTLTAEIEKASLGDKVTLIGQIEHKMIPTWISASDALCLPSHNEGVPNVVLEAISCGIPVIATKVGGIPEIVNDSNGILVDRQDHNALVKAISTAYKKDWNTKKITESIEGLTIENSAKKVKHILDLMIDGH